MDVFVYFSYTAGFIHLFFLLESSLCKCYLTGVPLFKDSSFALWMISRQVVIKQNDSLKTGPKIIYVDVSIGSEWKKTLTQKTPKKLDGEKCYCWAL